MRGQEGGSCRDTALMTVLTQRQASGAAGGTFPDLPKGKLSSHKSTGRSPSLCRLVSGVEAPRWEPPNPAPHQAWGPPTSRRAGKGGGDGTEGEGGGRRVWARC